MSTEYRIEYTIQRLGPGDDDWTDVGFGSSNGWSDVDAALYAVQTDVQNRAWETEPGMPEPDEIDREAAS